MTQQHLCGARLRRAAGRGDAVGRDVPRPARRLDLVSRGDVVAQSRPSLRDPAAPLRMGDLAARDEPHPRRDRRRAGGAAGDPALSLFDLFAGAAAHRLFRRAAGDGLGAWAWRSAACILRHGMGAESLAWLAVFMLAPVSAVYYPVSILPVWLQHVAWALPSTHVFEGMRAVMFEHVFRADYLLTAAGARPRLSGARRSRSSSSPSATPAAAARCCRWASEPARFAIWQRRAR